MPEQAQQTKFARHNDDNNNNNNNDHNDDEASKVLIKVTARWRSLRRFAQTPILQH